MIDLFITMFIFVAATEALLITFQKEPFPGDILIWNGKKYKVILWDGFDFYDFHLEDENGQLVKVDLHEIKDAKVTGIGIVRLFRYFREITGL